MTTDSTKTQLIVPALGPLYANLSRWSYPLIRAATGLILMPHGAQKLFGWFGGHGLEGTGGFFAQNLGLEPGVAWAALVGGTEFFGGFIGGDYDGQRWLDSKGYDPENGVVTQYTPAMDLSIADDITFGCTWQNTFDKVIGEGTGDNEMCILFGYAYPYEHAYSGQANPNGGCILIAPPEPGQ